MIGQLRGTILEKEPPYLLLDVNGVGYELTTPLSTFQHLPNIGEEIVLYTHFVVREDAHTLYGFHIEYERRLFRSLIKINGVGPKLALTILSTIGPDEFVTYITNQDIHQLIRIPGVGRKMAERLIIETKGTLTNWRNQTTPLTRSTQDAIRALISLGYKPTEAKRAISAVQEANLTSEDLIRQALKKIVTGV